MKLDSLSSCFVKTSMIGLDYDLKLGPRIQKVVWELMLKRRKPKALVR